MPIFKEYRKRLSQALEWIAHWLPRRHFFAAVSLSLALVMVAWLPDSSDASSGKTVINLSTGATTLATPPPSSAPSTQTIINNTATSSRELEQVLAQSDFSIDTSQSPPYTTSAPQMTSIPDSSDARLSLEVKPGDNLSLIFQRAGLNDRDLYEVTEGNVPDKKILTRLFPGYRLAFDIEDGTLNSLEIITGALESYHFKRDENDQFTVRQEIRTPEIRQTYKQATIDDSLFMAAQNGGISAAITMELAGIFGGVIDFMLDTRKGDTFTVIYEEKYLNGELIGNGQILAAQFVNQSEVHTAMRYVNTAGEANYFNLQGESMRKAFLKNPVDFVRISSNFNPNRRHPILNTIRAHKGTDYAAPTGTPVVATADGRVTFSSRNGSFGKLVVIQHNDRFETKYAHLNSYASGIKVGTRVRQGQVIGYIGSTGSATGPHLHYEFLMDGVHRNSRTIHDQLPKAESIASSEMPRFIEQTRMLTAQIDTVSNTTLALLENQDAQ